MTRILFFLFILSGTLVFGQSNHEPSLNNANNGFSASVFSVFMDPMYGYGTNENTVNFSSRAYWAGRATNNPNDQLAWFNYYKSTRYIAEGSAGFSELQEDLDTIAANLNRNCANTWEQLIVDYWNSNRDPAKEASLKKAYALRPNDALTLRLMTGMEYLHNSVAKVSDYYTTWKATGDLPASTESYAYNVFQSLPIDGIIFTNGEMDTYPLLYQLHKNNSTTIKVISIAFCKRADNRKAVFANAGLVLPSATGEINADFIAKVAASNPGKRIYVASTCNPEILNGLSGKLYCTGLAFRYSDAMLEHLEFLRNNVGARMNLDGVGKGTNSTHRFDVQYKTALDMNYYLPLLLAAESYAQMGDTDKAKELRTKAKLVRERAGYDEPLRDEGK